MMDLTDFIEHTEGLNVQGILVTVNGQEVARYLPEKDEARNIYSGTKSFTSAAVGLAVAEGMFALDDYVGDCFGDDMPPEPSDYLMEMKLVHLLTMSMGFEEPVLMGAMRPSMEEKDWVKFVLKQKVVRKPGTSFMYNNAGPYLLGVLVQRRSGMNLMEYLTPRLLEPLGIKVGKSEQCPMGYTFGAGGMFLNLDDFGKLGQLYLQEGRWEGKQILPAQWIRDSSREFIRAFGDEEIGEGYGYLFWTMKDGMYRADGKYEQYCIIYLDKHAVITVKAMDVEQEKDKAVLRAVLRYIVPRL